MFNAQISEKILVNEHLYSAFFYNLKLFVKPFLLNKLKLFILVKLMKMYTRFVLKQVQLSEFKIRKLYLFYC